MSDVVRCHKRWGYITVLLGINTLMGLILIATLLPDIPHPDPVTRIGMPVVGLVLLMFGMIGGQKIKDTSLYVLGDGVGVQYKRGQIKKITWDNIDNLGQGNTSLSVAGFRLKSYDVWLNQFGDDELRERAADGAIPHFLWGWLYLKRRSMPDNIRQEIEMMPKRSPKRILANRMTKLRGEQGVDLVFSDALCSRRDLELFEASYLRWKGGQEPKEADL